MIHYACIFYNLKPTLHEPTLQNNASMIDVSMSVPPHMLYMNVCVCVHAQLRGFCPAEQKAENHHQCWLDISKITDNKTH